MAPSGRHSSRAPHIARALEHSTMLARRHLAPRLSSSRLDRSARDARCSFARVITPRRHRKRISVTTSAGLFQSKEEKIVERYLNSKEGHAAILKAKKEGKSKKELLKMHKKDIVHLYSATEDLKLPFHLISKSQRMVFASFLNAVIDIPILNEAAEQVIFMKVVDVIADAIERQFKSVGSKVFFEGVTDMGETQLELWIGTTAKKINKKIDIPVLNEKQEQEAIEFILHAMTEKFLASKGIKRVPKKKKMFGFI